MTRIFSDVVQFIDNKLMVGTFVFLVIIDQKY